MEAIVFIVLQIFFATHAVLKIGGYLKGLGHAILGNFSADQMVIQLTKI